MILSTLLVAAQSASAMPAEMNALKPTAPLIDETYSPSIQVQNLSHSWSIMGCRIEEFSITGLDPVIQKPRSVSVTLYIPRRSEELKAAVIILPPTGGVNIIDRGYANEFCTSGLRVALISGWQHQDEVSLDFSMHNHGALRAVAATRHVVEFLTTQENSSIGILGTSIGALSAALTYGVDSRISAATFIVGSARFADVVAESDEAGAKKLRNERMLQHGYKDANAYRDALRAGIHYEPTAYLNDISDRKALVISADEDTTVPTDYQLELAQILNAEHIALRGNHLRGIKDAFWKHRADIRNFFLGSLAPYKR